MTDFTLDDETYGVLAGGQFRTVSLGEPVGGEFREAQFHFSQSSLDQDMEPHFFEIHYSIVGVSHESSA